MVSDTLQNFGIISAFAISIVSALYPILRNRKKDVMEYALKKDVDKDLKSVKEDLFGDIENIKDTNKIQIKAVHKRITEIDNQNKREHDTIKKDIIAHMDSRFNSLETLVLKVIKTE